MTIIIPFCSSPQNTYRNANLLRCLASLSECNGIDYASVVIADYSPIPLDCNLIYYLPIKVICVHRSVPFNRSAAVNLIATHSKSDIICKLDADLTVPVDFIHRASAIPNAKSAYFPVAFFKDSNGTDGIFRRSAAPTFSMTQNAFYIMGQLDEIMGKSWGGEDINLMYRCLDFGMDIDRQEEKGIVHHWHPTNIVEKNAYCDNDDITIVYGDKTSEIDGLVNRVRQYNNCVVGVAVSGQTLITSAHKGFIPQTQWAISGHRLLLGCPYWQTSYGARSTNLFAEHHITKKQLDYIYSYYRESAAWFAVDGELVAMRMRAYDFNHIRLCCDKKLPYRQIHDFMVENKAPSEWIEL